jgi:hypothetical protein
VLLRVPNFYEDFALTVEAGSIDEDLAWRSFGDLAVDEWRYWEAAIKVMREDDPFAYSEFEKLVKSLSKFDEAKKAQLAQLQERVD